MEYFRNLLVRRISDKHDFSIERVCRYGKDIDGGARMIHVENVYEYAWILLLYFLRNLEGFLTVKAMVANKDGQFVLTSHVPKLT